LILATEEDFIVLYLLEDTIPPFLKTTVFPFAFMTFTFDAARFVLGFPFLKTIDLPDFKEGELLLRAILLILEALRWFFFIMMVDDA
jgi:hypothetical protein